MELIFNQLLLTPLGELNFLKVYNLFMSNMLQYNSVFENQKGLGLIFTKIRF